MIADDKLGFMIGGMKKYDVKLKRRLLKEEGYEVRMIGDDNLGFMIGDMKKYDVKLNRRLLKEEEMVY